MRLNVLDICRYRVLCTCMCKHIRFIVSGLLFSTNNYDEVIMFIVIIDEYCY